MAALFPEEGFYFIVHFIKDENVFDQGMDGFLAEIAGYEFELYHSIKGLLVFLGIYILSKVY